MTEQNDKQSSVPKVSGKRSKRERLIVWGGIALLLAVMVCELQSRRGYDASLAAIEQRLNGGRTLPMAELPSVIHGFAFQSEDNAGRYKNVLLKWPSLLKEYKLRLKVLERDEVFAVETGTNRDNSAESATPPIANRDKQKGLPRGFEDVVALLTTDGPPMTYMSNSLPRELIRQALLIAAEDELGLATLDPSCGETIPMSDAPLSFPFTVRTVKLSESPANSSGSNPASETRIRIELSRPNAEGAPFIWSEQELVVPAENWLESLAEQLGKASQKSFVEAFKKAGYKQSKSTGEAGPTNDFGNRFDFVSQFAALRVAHQKIRADGADAELIGNLVRAYANLGSLTDYHWNPLSKVMKARSLIYAERLISVAGKTPTTLAHRAYARALAGRHMTGLIAAQEASALEGPAAPAFLPVIEAYCTYKKEILLNHKGPQKELAKYLLMRMTDLTSDVDREDGLRMIADYLTFNPSCFRAAEMLGDIPTLMVQRVLTVQMYASIWPAIYTQLTKIPDLPADVLKIASSGARTNRSDPSTEFALRASLIEALKKQVAPSQPDVHPSFSMLGDMLMEASFVQAWHSLEFQATWLGVPVEPAQLELKPLYESHRCRGFLESYSSDRHKAGQLLSKFIAGVDLPTLELPARVLMKDLFQRTGQPSQELIDALASHQDPLYEDAIRSAFEGYTSQQLITISPDWPTVIGRVINGDSGKPFDRNEAANWEKRFANSSPIMVALGKAYKDRRFIEDAKRCLKRSIEISPSNSAWEMLAEIFDAEDDFDNWKDALEHSIELPSFGLESAKLQQQLAEALMRRGEWEQARFHAEQAANTGAAWGMRVLARCAEGLGEWDLAERMNRAMSQRYQNLGSEWYFWCIRTGKGGVAAAKAVADDYFERLKPPYQPVERRQLAARMILDGNLKAAREVLQPGKTDLSIDGGAAIFAAVLADQLDEIQARDFVIGKLTTLGGSDQAFTEFTNLMVGVLNGQDIGKWNRRTFEQSVIAKREYDVPYLYYYAGLFLRKHGEPDLANEYLQCAATTFDVERIACMLANVALRADGKTVPESRLNNVPDDVAPVDKLLRQSDLAQIQNRVDDAEKYLNKLLSLRADSIPGLIARASLFEAKGDYAAAIRDYEEAMQLDPKNYLACNKLAWLLATCPDDSIRNGKRSLELAEHAASFRFIRWRMSLSTIAAAYAELGDFEKAIEFETKAQPGHSHDADYDYHIGSYQAKKPYRRPKAPLAAKAAKP